MTMQNKNKAFTMVEVLISITIFTIIMIVGFQALSSIMIGKVKLIENATIQKQAFYFSEKLFDMIKKGGTIDYEEYFNRKMVGTQLEKGHYKNPTGFGNFGQGGVLTTPTYGEGIYFCRSTSTKIDKIGCSKDKELTSKIDGNSPDPSPLKTYQRYGQYSFHFIDYNSNYNNDNGDEDGKSGIKGDDDDLYLGTGPEAFSTGTNLHEIYLISGNKKTRTLFRWTVSEDPTNKPTNATCDLNNSTGTPSGDGCLGNIEFLKLTGKDYGENHGVNGKSKTYDGVIDTWLYHKDFSTDSKIATNGKSKWVKLFPDDINVKSFKIFAYPNKDTKLAWKEEDQISPYIRIQMTLMPSRKKRRGIKGEIPKININTTISLTEILSK